MEAEIARALRLARLSWNPEKTAAAVTKAGVAVELIFAAHKDARRNRLLLVSDAGATTVDRSLFGYRVAWHVPASEISGWQISKSGSYRKVFSLFVDGSQGQRYRHVLGGGFTTVARYTGGELPNVELPEIVSLGRNLGDAASRAAEHAQVLNGVSDEPVDG